MLANAPLSPRFRWLYRHRRAVRISCLGVIALEIAVSVISFSRGDIKQGLFRMASVGGPLVILRSVHAVEWAACRDDDIDVGDIVRVYGRSVFTVGFVTSFHHGVALVDVADSDAEVLIGRTIHASVSDLQIY